MEVVLIRSNSHNNLNFCLTIDDKGHNLLSYQKLKCSILYPLIRASYKLKNKQTTPQLCFFHLRNTARFHPRLSFSDTKWVIHVLNSSWLDHCNALFSGLFSSTQPSTTCAELTLQSWWEPICSHPPHSTITPVLQDLQWLPVQQKTDFQVFLLTFKALHGSALGYLSELIHPYCPTWSLCSSDYGTHCPQNTPIYGWQSFPWCGRMFSLKSSELLTTLSVFHLIWAHTFRVAFKCIIL